MFQPAIRGRAKLKCAIAGPSGSGKTLGALLIAKGLSAGKIAVADSENGSASLYAGKSGIEFDSVSIKPPYTTEKYIAAIEAAIQGGYGVLIIDSLSHAWAGEGGLLQQKESIDSRGGNSFTNWRSITPKHEAFMAKILNSDIHIIATMRSKQDYVMETSDKGKQMPKKVGLAPIQRDGAEYEFTTVFDVAMSHDATVSKDRTGLFDGRFFKITEQTGKDLAAWFEGGNPLADPAPEVKADVENSLATLVNEVRDQSTRDMVLKSIEESQGDAEKQKFILDRLQNLIANQPKG